MTNALHTRSSKHNWSAFYIQELIKAKDISVENKPDWKKLIIFFLYRRPVFAPTKIDVDDAEMNPNVVTWTVLGTLKSFFSMTAKLQCQRQMHVTTTLGIEPKLRINGYDAGFKRDEYDCNLDTCECQHNGTDPVCGKFYKAF